MSVAHRNRGFSLIELLIGVLVTMIGSVVIFQIFALSERQKRTTVGSSDAQTNGAVAMYLMERDVKMAGWGLETGFLGGCTQTFSYYDDGATAGPVNDLFASVSIKDGGNGPDTINILYYGNPNEPDVRLGVTTLRSTMPQPSAELKVSNTDGCSDGGLIIIRDGTNGNCTLMEVTQVQPASSMIQHNPGNAPTYNPKIPYQTANNWPAYKTGAAIQCFSSIFRRVYQVNNQHLELLEPNALGAVQTFQVAPNIIDVQAEYGIADLGSQQVNAWVPATGVWAGTLPTTEVKRIKAVRIAVLARSEHYEKPEGGAACTATTSSMMSTWPSWASFSPTNLPADWECYRFKAFEMVVPLRNVIWSNA